MYELKVYLDVLVHVKQYIIDYSKYTISSNLDNKQLILPTNSDYHYLLTVPPRCEIFKYFKINTNDECVMIPLIVLV